MELVMASPTAKDVLIPLIGVEVLAAGTGLGGPVRIHVVNRESLRSRLVFQHLSELAECPSVEIRSLCRSFSLTSLSNSLEVFYCYALRTALLGFPDNRVGEQVVLLALPLTLFPAELTQLSSSPSGALAL